MKTLLILALLSLPSAVCGAAPKKTSLEDSPVIKDSDLLEPVQRPDSQKIMSELSTALRLSVKQEQRISAAVAKRTAAFDKLMKEFDRNSAEEKKWRYKMNANRYEMIKLNRELPDAIRDFLDDEQRESYDEMLAAERKSEAAATGSPQEGEEAPEAAAPVKRKVLVKRRKLVPAVQSEDETGQVMVDQEAAVQPAPRKRKVLKKKPAPAEAEERAGARPTGKEAPVEEEDAGSYP